LDSLTQPPVKSPYPISGGQADNPKLNQSI
jgi:hypothetical protein